MTKKPMTKISAEVLITIFIDMGFYIRSMNKVLMNLTLRRII